MDTNELITTFIYQFIAQVPYLLILIAGIIMALIKFGKHRKPAIFSILGLFTLLLTHIFYMVYPLITQQFVGSQIETATALMILQAISFFAALISAIGFGLLIYAVWAGRVEGNEAGAMPPNPPNQF